MVTLIRLVRLGWVGQERSRGCGPEDLHGWDGAVPRFHVGLAAARRDCANWMSPRSTSSGGFSEGIERRAGRDSSPVPALTA
jgi:hypothetical protein